MLWQSDTIHILSKVIEERTSYGWNSGKTLLKYVELLIIPQWAVNDISSRRIVQNYVFVENNDRLTCSEKDNWNRC